MDLPSASSILGMSRYFSATSKALFRLVTGSSWGGGGAPGGGGGAQAGWALKQPRAVAMHTEGVGTVPKGSKEERLSFPGLGSGDSWHKALPVCPSEQRPALGASEGGAWGKWPGDRGRLGVSGGPPRGARDTYLSQLVILDQLWSVPVDQGIEGEPVLPAVDRKAEIRRTASHCHRRTAGQGAHRKDQRPWGVV